MNTSYGKLYTKTFTGSMFGAGATTFAVWCYAIANARPPDGRVELNPKLLSAILGEDEKDVEKAIEVLSGPDPHSRTTKEEGRRMIKTGSFEFVLVNFVEHRGGRCDEDRRASVREAVRRHRIRKSGNVIPNVISGNPTKSQAEAEAEANSNAAQAQRSAKKLSDEEWLGSLRKSPAYESVDIDMELRKMDAWLSVRPGRKKTRRFIVNWLNKVEAPVRMVQKKVGVDSISVDEGKALAARIREQNLKKEEA